jgi:hypothetical protein
MHFNFQPFTMFIFLVIRKNVPVKSCSSFHHHHSEHGQGLGLKTCSFEAQGVPGSSILLSVFPYPAIPEVGTGRPASVGGFYPFVPGGLPISFDSVLCPPLCCPLSNCYGSQDFSGGPILWVLIVVSEISFAQLPVFGHPAYL